MSKGTAPRLRRLNSEGGYGGTILTVALLNVLALACHATAVAQVIGSASLNVERAGHSATQLRDGRVLIVGGENAGGALGTAELFDPADQRVSVSESLLVPRTEHTATLLADGRVLVIGGRQSAPLASTEIFDPAAGSFAAGPAMTTARSGHSATALGDGRILVAGGDAQGSAEIFDPVTFRFTALAATLSTPRWFAGAALLRDGTVLIVGGADATGQMLQSAEIFTPATPGFSEVASALQVARENPLLRVLPDGKVLIIGGSDDSTIELFDPAGPVIRAHARVLNTSNTLSDILRSWTRGSLIHPLQPGDPQLQTQLTPSLRAFLDRTGHSLTELPGRNQALVAGGADRRHRYLGSADLLASSAATITTDRSDYSPGSVVEITGGGWQPGENVRISIHEESRAPRPSRDASPDVAYDAVADLRGDLVNREFSPDSGDVGRTFLVTAVGQSSGFVAQTAFTDGTCISGTVASMAPVTAVQGTQKVPILSMTVACSKTSSTLRSAQVTYMGTTAADIGTLSIYRENGMAPGFQPSQDLLVGSVAIKKKGTNVVLNAVNAKASNVVTSAGATFYFVVDLKPAAARGDTVAVRLAKGKITFSDGTWPTSPIGPLGGTTITSGTAVAVRLVSGTTPSVPGQSLTFRATVTQTTGSSSGSPVGAGSVTFRDGAFGPALCSDVALGANGQASCVTSSLAVGAHQIVASYAGASNFDSSDSVGGPLAQEVDKAATTTAVTSSRNPSAFGEAVTFTATVSVVSPGTGTPDGTVTFLADGTPIASCGTVRLDKGTAACAVSTLPVVGSPHAITASYGGSDSHGAGSATLHGGQTVSKATPAFGALSAPAITYGDATTVLSGVITAGSASPGGNVSITLDGITQIAAINPSTGAFTSSFSTGSLAVSGSPYAIAYRYAGDSNTEAGSDTSRVLTVARANQSIVWGNPADITYGTALGPAQLKATVGAPGPDPAGALSYTPAAGVVLDAGVGQTLSVTAAATANYNAATLTVSINVLRATPALTWPAPGDIKYPTGLSAAQLNATASSQGAPIPGTFTYRPPLGTVLDVGIGQSLHVDFTPADARNFTVTSKDVTLNVMGTSLTITAPLADGTVPPGPLLVQGTVRTTEPPITVVVNGVPAGVQGTTFTAVVLVGSGATTLSAVATGVTGVTASSSLTVNVLPSPDETTQLIATPSSGVAPLTVSFSLHGAQATAAIELDFDGDGTVDFTGPSLQDRTFTYTQPGLYVPVAIISDGQGGEMRVKGMVVVQSPSVVTAWFQSLWSSFKARLVAGDTAGALTYLSPALHSEFGQVFQALGPNLPAIGASLENLAVIEQLDDLTEAAIIREEEGTPFLYFIYFRRDGLGRWVIEEM